MSDEFGESKVPLSVAIELAFELDMSEGAELAFIMELTGIDCPATIAEGMAGYLQDGYDEDGLRKFKIIKRGSKNGNNFSRRH